MSVRPMREDDVPEVLAMMRALWADFDDVFPADEQVLVWERAAGGLGGFVSYSLRPWAEGTTSTPCPYVEGWYVAPDLRGSGVGRALFGAVEEWCVANGHTELASDVELDNDASLRAHAALGFEPTLRVQFFRKALRSGGEGR